ncbi:glycosyltransferase family 39 protein [bacterium]|nr:glycosyltransferase family 39 protein [bacterium]
MIKKKNWLFWLILAGGVFLRFYKLADYMEFLGDQGRDVLIVRRFLTKGDLMFIGPQTSVGNMYLGPWYYYLIAPALLLANFNPLGPAVLVALFGIATIWLSWKVGREWFGERIALLAALLTAASPVLVYYSIFSWNPNIMPFFALLSMWLLWRIWEKGEYRKMPLLAFSLAMVLNSHYLGLLLFPVVGLFLLLTWYKSRQNPSFPSFSIHYSLFSILIFLALMSPLLLFDLKHNFANFHAFRHFFTVRQTTVNLKFYKGFLRLPEIFNQLYAQILVRKDFWQPAYLVFPVILLLLWRERKNRVVWLLAAWLLVGLLGLSNYKQHIYAHYYGFLYPVAIVLLAAALSRLKLVALPIVGFLVYLMVINWHGWQPPGRQLERARSVARFIEEKSRGEKFALALLAERNYADSYRYFLVLDKAPLVNLHQEIPSQLFVICEPWGKVDCNPIGNPLWEIAAFGWAEIDRQWELEGVKVFKLVHSAR